MRNADEGIHRSLILSILHDAGKWLDGQSVIGDLHTIIHEVDRFGGGLDDVEIADWVDCLIRYLPCPHPEIAYF
jgi:hypothetical protein